MHGLVSAIVVHLLYSTVQNFMFPRTRISSIQASIEGDAQQAKENIMMITMMFHKRLLIYHNYRQCHYCQVY